MSNEYGGGGGFGGFAAGSGIVALADTIKGLWYGTAGTVTAVATYITPFYYLSTNNNTKKNTNTSNLPNQGKVIGNIEGAPPVHAGKQGKHVIGHPSNKHSLSEGGNKSTWPEGETGVDLTQEGWLKGEPKANNPNVRVWDTGRVIGSNGETKVNVKYAPGKGTIHGYSTK